MEMRAAEQKNTGKTVAIRGSDSVFVQPLHKERKAILLPHRRGGGRCRKGHLVEERLVLAPPLAHLHEQAEEDPGAKNASICWRNSLPTSFSIESP
jgi:hypothetical protein